MPHIAVTMVSVEDVEMKEWENSMQRIPAETIIVNPNKK